MPVPVERKETFTYTSPDGVVFVITGVPALVYESEEGVKEVRYKPASSRIVNKYIREGLKAFSEPNVYYTSFEEAEKGLVADAQVRFVGENVGLYTASLDTWRMVTTKLQGAYDEVKKVYKEVLDIKTVRSPVAIPASGSLIFGLKAHHKPPLFENYPELDDLITDEIRVLQLLIDGHAYVNGEKVENQLLLSHPLIQLGVVKAVEKLSPDGKGALTEVQILPKSKLFESDKSVTFTPDTHFKANRLRKRMEKADSPERRDVVLVGQIETLSRSGRMTVRDVEYSYPEFKNYATTALFPDGLWEALSSHFKQKGKRLLFRGVEFEINGQWSNEPIIKSVEEAPASQEVRLLANERMRI